MAMSDLTERLRKSELHSAEAYDVEEYLPMAQFWDFYRNLSAEAASALEAQEARIAELERVLMIVQPLFSHALYICDAEGVGPNEEETDVAEALISKVLSKPIETDG